MIELGLRGISRLLKDIPIPWRAIHVAGTNGKGSVCSYASAMLNAANIKCGRFTSPHLIDRWDCITINDRVVDRGLFHQVEDVVKARDQSQDTQASEFELLTATAFEIFNREQVEVGVVEVGLGGRYDATNVLQDPLVTVITKIGKDHQSFLGNSLEEITDQKAGIMKQDVACLVDGSNEASVIDVLKQNADTSKAAYMMLVPQGLGSEAENILWSVLGREDYEDHQQMNVTLAYEAVKIGTAILRPLLDSQHLLSALQNTSWPGRLQTLDLAPLTGQSKHALLDGAHNAQSAQILGSFVDRKLRQTGRPVTWILSMSRGKDVQEILHHLLRSGDGVFAVEFGPVDSMPWVQPESVKNILREAAAQGWLEYALEGSVNLEDTVRLAAEKAGSGPVVIAGSLYLVSDILRILRNTENI